MPSEQVLETMSGQVQDTQSGSFNVVVACVIRTIPNTNGTYKFNIVRAGIGDGGTASVGNAVGAGAINVVAWTM